MVTEVYQDTARQYKNKEEDKENIVCNYVDQAMIKLCNNIV